MHDRERQDRFVLGLLAAILTIAAIAYVLLVSPGTQAIHSDACVPVMETLGLCYLEEDGATAAGTFGYERYDAGVMLTGRYRSIAWAGAVVRLMTQPFGQPFSTGLLAVVYALLIGVGAYLAVSGLARHSLTAAYLTLAAYPLSMLHPAWTGYLNSLYIEGAAIAFLMLFLGCLVHTLCQPRGSGTIGTLAVIFCAALLVNSAAWMMAFAPAAAVGCILCIWHTCPRSRARMLHIAVTSMAVMMAFVSVFTGFSADQDIHSDAANYLSVFQGILPYAEEPEETLAALGLDASYAADIGRSYYEPEEAFVHNPRSADADFLDQLTLADRMKLVLSQPKLISAILEDKAVYLRDAYSPYLTLPDGGMLNGHAGIYVILETMAGQGGMHVLLNRAVLAAIISVLLLMTAPRKSGLKLLPWCMLALSAGLAVYVPLGMIMTGSAPLERAKAVWLLLSWALLFYSVGGGLLGGMRVFAWLSEKNTRLSPVAEEQSAPVPVLALLRRIPLTRGVLLTLTALAWIALACWELLPESHIGGVNNGDFGRMMEQIDLYWTQPQLDATDTQLATQVIEDYSYREPFHPERLTPADPTYSLLFPSMLVRLWSAVTGNPFSTQVLALIMLALTMLSVLSILRDLYPMLGRLTVLPAIALTVMLLGENYVAWYNSLFGESSISTGLMMTIACALHLAVLPRSGKGSLRYLLLLAVGIRFLCCAKAQMALALPVGLLLLVVFAVYHHPKKIVRCTAFALLTVLLGSLITWDTLGVYRKNAGISEKQTIWQSVFYGALMVSDDPESAMEELGIPLEMKADIGKHAYYADSDYVYPLLSDEAQENFYDHVNTISMVGYYLRHPLDLLEMLDHAAQESVTLHTGFMAYTDEAYDQTQGPYRVTLWANLRTLTAGRAFWQYVLMYGAVLVICVRRLLRRDLTGKQKLLAVLLLALMCIGVFQYPLTVIGNGFADNNKQLYAFMLCHDLLVVSLVTIAAHWLLKAAHSGEDSIQEGGSTLVPEEESV